MAPTSPKMVRTISSRHAVGSICASGPGAPMTASRSSSDGRPSTSDCIWTTPASPPDGRRGFCGVVVEAMGALRALARLVSSGPQRSRVGSIAFGRRGGRARGVAAVRGDGYARRRWRGGGAAVLLALALLGRNAQLFLRPSKTNICLRSWSRRTRRRVSDGETRSAQAFYASQLARAKFFRTTCFDPTRGAKGAKESSYTGPWTCIS